MNGVDIAVVAGGFIAIGTSQFFLYYKVGRVEQKVDDLNGFLNKGKRR